MRRTRSSLDGSNQRYYVNEAVHDRKGDDTSQKVVVIFSDVQDLDQEHNRRGGDV